MGDLLARWHSWRVGRQIIRCAAGKHQWRHISDRVYCKACRRWWHGLDSLTEETKS